MSNRFKIVNLSQRFALIGSTFIFSKIIFLIIAWLLSPQAYFQFNKIYYSASTISIFSGLGFSFALYNSRTRNLLVYALVGFNTLVTLLFMFISGFGFENGADLSNSVILAFILSVTGIFSFIILYSGNYRRYFYLNIYLFLLQIAALIITRFTGLKFEWLFTVSIICWFFISYKSYFKGDRGIESIKPLYMQGLSIFIINSSALLMLTADKFVINHYFIPVIANAYTFAWGVTAPLFYTGNVLERMIYSLKSSRAGLVKRKNLLFITSGLQLGISMLYISAVLLVVYYYPNILPGSVSYEHLIKILPVMLAGYAVYTVLHFPLNGILLKYTGEKARERTAIYFTGAILLFFIILLTVFKSTGDVTFYTLLLLIWAYLFTLTIIRIFVIRSSNPI